MDLIIQIVSGIFIAVIAAIIAARWTEKYRGQSENRTKHYEQIKIDVLNPMLKQTDQYYLPILEFKKENLGWDRRVTKKFAVDLNEENNLRSGCQHRTLECSPECYREPFYSVLRRRNILSHGARAMAGTQGNQLTIGLQSVDSSEHLRASFGNLIIQVDRSTKAQRLSNVIEEEIREKRTRFHELKAKAESIDREFVPFRAQLATQLEKQKLPGK